MTNRLMLIDINNLGYASMYQPALATLEHDGLSTAAIHGALSSLIRLMEDFHKCVPIVLWDGDAKWRRDIYPEYKAQRADHDKSDLRADYKRQSVILRSIMSVMGIPQVFHKDMEADDLAGLIIRSLDPEKYEILMVSSDHDWWQGLADNTAWYSHKTKEFINLEDLSTDKVKDGPFKSVKHFLECKSMVSDPSDNIQGVRGVGMKTAKKILERMGGWDSLENSTEVFKEGSKERMVMDNIDVIKRNRELVDWRYSPAPQSSPEILYSSAPFDRDAFVMKAMEYGLDYVARRYSHVEIHDSLIEPPSPKGDGFLSVLLWR